MTDDDKALVKWLRDEAALAYDREDTNTLNETANRIEAQAAEIEKLREALTQIARLRTDLRGDFSLGSKQSDIARAALGETK